MPASLAFGHQGYSFRSTRHADKEGLAGIPPDSDVVSISHKCGHAKSRCLHWHASNVLVCFALSCGGCLAGCCVLLTVSSHAAGVSAGGCARQHTTFMIEAVQSHCYLSCSELLPILSQTHADRTHACSSAVLPDRVLSRQSACFLVNSHWPSTACEYILCMDPATDAENGPARPVIFQARRWQSPAAACRQPRSATATGRHCTKPAGL